MAAVAAPSRVSPTQSTQANSMQAKAPQTNGVSPSAQRPSTNGIKRPVPARKSMTPQSPATPQQPSAYGIMAQRIANRVAEMAEGITFVERPAKPDAQQQTMAPEERKKPRKLDMRFGSSGQESVSFSAPFLDNTLQKMLALQNRMLTTTATLSSTLGIDERAVKEQAAQSAELSRIIAMICAEKARETSG